MGLRGEARRSAAPAGSASAGGNGQRSRIHFQVSGFSLARRALILHSVFIYVSVERRLYRRWRRRRRGRSGLEGHTYYVINPRPLPPAGGAARRGPQPGAPYSPGFLVPAPHGHSLRTGLRVVPPPVAPRPASTPHSVCASSVATSTHDIIHANLRSLIFLPSDRSETVARHREC